MDYYWESTPYLKWYKSHRRFSFMAKLFIEEFKENGKIPVHPFASFVKSLSCHSKSEERMFANIPTMTSLFQDHVNIDIHKAYTEEEKYDLCISLLDHMREEEDMLRQKLSASDKPYHQSIHNQT